MNKVFPIFILLLLHQNVVALETYESLINHIVVVKDYSSYNDFDMEEPQMAYINIVGIECMPQRKFESHNGYIEYIDENGITFRKKVRIKVQGNSSLVFPKKNFTADIIENDVDEKDTKISIGNWVSQKSFHLKAYYIDFFRGIAIVGYTLYDEIVSDRPNLYERLGGGSFYSEKAKYHPDGFPCMVFLNGQFEGVYVWELKKHRDNMNQKKNNASEIHLDGSLLNEYLWDGIIDWTQFEVRNPKPLYNMAGEIYDGDYPTELIDDNSIYFNEGNDKVKDQKQRSLLAKKAIVNLSQRCNFLKVLEKTSSTLASSRDGSMFFSRPVSII